MEEIDYTERTCIIVVEIAGEGSHVLTGLVVDAVSEVLNIKADNIEAPPAFGAKLNTDYILGMAKSPRIWGKAEHGLHPRDGQD